MPFALLLCLLVAAGGACAGEIARWEAGSPPVSRGIVLAVHPESDWHIETAAGQPAARLKPAADYFHRAAFLLKIDPAPSGAAWLVAEYLDRGYSLITISPGVPQRNQHGVARLDSGRFRRAVFRFDKPRFDRPLRLEGIEYLRSVSLTDSAPRLEPLPEAKAAVGFRVPSERVTTAAAEVPSVESLEEALAGLRNQLPLARALGFNGIESYVRWGFVERKPGVYDWSFYDALLAEIEKHGLQWFPMLLAGSGYALPEWFYESSENKGFVCLEHGIQHDTQTIFYGNQANYAQRFIAEFGRRYGPRQSLLGIRLGPSGDYGEAQYPAKGPGYKWRESHTHIGYWAADPYAQEAFRDYLRALYPDIAALNRAWDERFRSFYEVRTFLPVTAVSRRKRIDFANWYMGAMSDWCQKWAVWAREAMPQASIHQSSGGWGPVEIGTDYSRQARDMARVKGGLRLTNEADNFADNFSITRMASSAARFYGARLGYEPGGYGSKRGVMARLYNTLTNGGDHLFYYLSNLTANDHAIEAWLHYGPLLDQRAKPIIEVAAFYSDTTIKLDDDVLRYRFASAFLTKARALRAELDYDYVSEQMILDGALDRYKALVFLWGHVTEKPVLERIDRWLRGGGTVIYPVQPRGLLMTVDGDTSAARRWQEGDTGRGRAVFYLGDSIPGEPYARFIAGELRRLPQLRPETQAALKLRTPAGVFWSVLESGSLALLNFADEEAAVRLPGGGTVTLAPYAVAVVPTGQWRKR
jgi:hypothetical protein